MLRLFLSYVVNVDSYLGYVLLWWFYEFVHVRCEVVVVLISFGGNGEMRQIMVDKWKNVKKKNCT